MKKKLTKKNAEPAKAKKVSAASVKTANKKVTALKTTVKKAGKVAKQLPEKKVGKAAPVKVKKTIPVKTAKAAPTKKIAKQLPETKVGKAAPVKVKKTVPVKAAKTAPAKKAAKTVPEKNVGKAAPVKVKKAVPVKAVKAAPAKKVVKPVPVKKATPAKKITTIQITDEIEVPIRKNFRMKHIKLAKSKKKFYTNLLMTLRSEFSEQIQFHRDDALNSKKDSAGERAGMATHMADLGSDNFRHDLELGLLSDEGDVLEMIDEALLRLQDDEFGVCLDCGKEINPERLEAKPYARYCTACKSLREKLEDPRKRHR